MRSKKQISPMWPNPVPLPSLPHLLFSFQCNKIHSPAQMSITTFWLLKSVWTRLSFKSSRFSFHLPFLLKHYPACQRLSFLLILSLDWSCPWLLHCDFLFSFTSLTFCSYSLNIDILPRTCSLLPHTHHKKFHCYMLR